MRARIQDHIQQADRRLLRTAGVVLAWAAAWLTVRYGGDGNVAAAGAYVLPTGLAAYLFGWHAGAATGIASAAFAGPLSPALATEVTTTETVTFALMFVVAAGLASVAHPNAAAAGPVRAEPDQFGGVARELFSPVQAIQGAVAMLDRLLPGDGEERVALRTLDRANGRLEDLHRLVSAVGDELTTERRAADQTLVDLRLVAGNVASELRGWGGLERLRFDAAHDADVVMGHQERVHLLLRCLVGDALENGTSREPVDCTLRRDGGTVVVRVCAVSGGTSAIRGRIRMVAAEKLAAQLGATFEALDAGGASQVTVRLPQRRDTDPRQDRGTFSRPTPKREDRTAVPVPIAAASSVWARVAG